MQALDKTPFPLDHLAGRGRAGDPALIDGDGALDYAGLEAAVGALAGGLIGQDLKRGDRVASWLAKTRLACLMPLACARAGLVHVPINPLLKRGQAAHILANSGAALLIAGGARAASLLPSDIPRDCKVLIEDSESNPLLDDGPLPPSSADPHDLAAILYTSGSSGRPKGVMLSHANLALGAVAVAHYLELAHDDRTLAVLPLAFDYGQNQLLSTWAAGGCVYPLDYLLPRDVMRAVTRYGITTLAGVPPLWVQLDEVDWPPDAVAPLRRLTNSGGRLPAPLIRRLRARFPRAKLFSMYGLTEAFRSTFLDPALIDVHPESIGRAIPLAEVLVVRPDGVLAAEGEEGELVHAGPLVAQGYWDDPERTAARFRPAPAGSRYGGTAVWSGDTVVRDAHGLLRFVGRVDEMIKTSGHRVSPSEVEEAALASGAVAEAMALGVPDARLGEAIMLIAVARGEAAEERLRDYLKRELPGFMQPRRLLWRATLPRNVNGKLDRATLRAELGG